MLDFVKAITRYYLETNKTPEIKDLNIWENIQKYTDKKWSIFVTIYKLGELVWSKWNIVPIESNFVNEIIKSTVWALEDSRFWELNLLDLNNLKFRIDLIKSKRLLKDEKISDISPIKYWIIAIKNDYEKLWVVLPNISTDLKEGADFYKVLDYKLDEKFDEKNYILYEFETSTITDF